MPACQRCLCPFVQLACQGQAYPAIFPGLHSTQPALAADCKADQKSAQLSLARSQYPHAGHHQPCMPCQAGISCAAPTAPLLQPSTLTSARSFTQLHSCIAHAVVCTGDHSGQVPGPAERHSAAVVGPHPRCGPRPGRPQVPRAGSAGLVAVLVASGQGRDNLPLTGWHRCPAWLDNQADTGSV